MRLKLTVILAVWIFASCKAFSEQKSIYSDIKCPEGFYHYNVGLACCPCSRCPTFDTYKYVSGECFKLYEDRVIRDPNKLCISYSKQGCWSYDYIISLTTTQSSTTSTPATPSTTEAISSSTTESTAANTFSSNSENTLIYLVLGTSGVVVFVTLVIVSVYYHVERMKREMKKCKGNIAVVQPATGGTNSREDTHEQDEKRELLGQNDDTDITMLPVAESEPDASFDDRDLKPKGYEMVYNGPSMGPYSSMFPTKALPYNHAPPSYHSHSSRPPPASTNVNINPTINSASNCTVIIAQDLSNLNFTGAVPPHYRSPPDFFPAAAGPMSSAMDNTTPSIFTTSDYGSERCVSSSCQRQTSPSHVEHDVGTRPVHIMRNDHPSSMVGHSKTSYASSPVPSRYEPDHVASLDSRAFSHQRSETEAKECTFSEAVDRTSLARRTGRSGDFRTQISCDSDLPDLLHPPSHSDLDDEDIYSSSNKFDAP